MRSVDYAINFMKKVKMPEEAIRFINDAFKKAEADKKSIMQFFVLERRYMCVTRRFMSVKPQLLTVAKRLRLPKETVDFMFLLFCTNTLHDRFIKKGYSDDLFYATMADLKYKLIECKNVKGVWGTFVPSWYDGFFRMERFALGRFQFETTRYAWLKYDKFGVKLRKHTRVVNFHIPSCGPIDYETRLDSYKQAYEFYRKLFGDGPSVFVCTSWLLYKKHYEFLPIKSNILDFMDDFDIVKSLSLPCFADGWRVFNDKAKLPVEELPEDTSLQRAFKQRLLDKKPTGMGYGVIVFDGENILTRSHPEHESD